MHLQSLELFGFKSFADKTVFNFHEGVTAVVGPNGCGKSNVLDAVRWVLGEQSAKSLRGGEMADVIFNGAESRKPLGFAEVSLTFTDCAAELGVDWHDVRVTRRIHRDGISEYLLNKTVCRLKDIHTLFADTGIGRAAYSMMEQGKIDLILSSRPEDRRSVFEEAAGITRYKTQKKEALRKLEATEANLLRIGDIIKEVKRQIGSLQRQAGKARRYQALHADLQVIDTHFSHRKLQRIETELAACISEIERTSEAERETRARIDAGENELAVLRNELDATDDRITAQRTSLQQLENEIASHNNRIQFNEQRRIELDELIARAHREIQSAETKLREHEGEVESANVLVEQMERLIEEQKAQLQQLVTRASEHHMLRESTDRRLQELQLNLSRDEVRLAAAVQELEQLRGRRDATSREALALAAKIASASNEQKQFQERVQSARSAAEHEQQAVEQLFAQMRRAEDELRSQQSGLAEIDKQLVMADRTIGEAQSRYDVLRQLNEEGEGLAQGSQAILRATQFPIGGALAAQLDVPPEFVAAIEAALGRNLQAVILREPGRASDIISYLNEQQLGQAALMLKGLPIPAHSSSEPLPAGAIAWAADKVDAPEELIAIVRNLLHNVAIFSDLPTALRAAAASSCIAGATLQGEFISAEGILFAGSAKTGTDSLLKRKAIIDALAAELERRRQDRSAIEELRHSKQIQVAQLTADLEGSRAAYQESHSARTVSAAAIADLERQLHSAERDFEILKSEHSTLDRQLAAADARLYELEQLCRDLEGNITAARTAVERGEQDRVNAAQQTARVESELGELRIGIATSEQRHQALLAQRAPMLARRNELSELIAARSTEIKGYQTRLVSQAAETASARNSIQLQTAERSRHEEEIAKALAERRSRSDTINAQETALREARQNLSELQEKRGTYSVRQTQLQLQGEHLVEHVRERYQMNLREFVPDSYAQEKVLRAQLKQADTDSTTEEDVQRLISDLARQLDNMGPVNLEAVQEYDELEERHRFLENQNTDLTNSRRELLDVIARINNTTQRLFAETFAQVRVNFREMFIELFGGGRADLQLMDDNDALNCGIEIIAKPPGKQLQSISLLSGGERTLTAVALLFAIYMVRPSPFCVLDEMDAPLDESNINRFIRVLERFVNQSQFIIITHNKRTIAKADILYGVTMEERGVSKLVGVKMTPPKLVETNTPVTAVQEQRHFSMSDERERSLAASR